MSESQSNSPTSDGNVSHNEVREFLEGAIMTLPISYRSVIGLREVEEISTRETPEVLSLTSANVEGRLHRARECYGQSNSLERVRVAHRHLDPPRPDVTVWCAPSLME